MSALAQPWRTDAEANEVCDVTRCTRTSGEHHFFFMTQKQTASVMVSIQRQEAEFHGGFKTWMRAITDFAGQASFFLFFSLLRKSLGKLPC